MALQTLVDFVHAGWHSDMYKRTKHPACVPDIAGVDKDKVFNPAEPYLEILGVKVDTLLSWKYHVEHIYAKASKTLRQLKCISGWTWGGESETDAYTLLYILLAPYLCHKKLSITKALAKELDKLEYKCLRELSSSFKGTCADGRPIDQSLAFTCKQVAREMTGLGFRCNTINFTTLYSDALRVTAARWEHFWHCAKIVTTATFGAHCCKFKDQQKLQVAQAWVDKVALEYPDYAPVLHAMLEQQDNLGEFLYYN
ncbi:hypothetical protein PG997_009012 [Apiospora hydei]|uniref:Uncharacterized protein n=1 Tax=Apiospora hydei TaxID=1337664 RepID=A0ABR1WCF3_9PEZI